jgi:rhamnosyltransferase subunit B
MAHFIVTSIGTYGDIFPFAQLAIALQKQNYKVTFITNPYFEETIHQFGLTFYPIGTKEQYTKVLMSEGLWNDKEHLDITSTLHIPNLEAIHHFVTTLDPIEKIVILSHQNFLTNAGLAQCYRKDITIICGALYPSVFRAQKKKIKLGSFTLPKSLGRLAWWFIEKYYDQQYLKTPLIKPVNLARERHGLKPLGGYPELFDQVASFNLLLFDKWFGLPEKTWPKNLIQGAFLLNENPEPVPLPNDLQDFMKAGTKPILFTFGTGNMHSKKYFELAVAALQRLKLRAIFICKDRHHLPEDLPPSILWIPYFKNFSVLLKQCNLVIYHGGIGTLAEAARAGIPQILIPSLGDQWDNAERIEKLQLGASISTYELDTENLIETIQKILESKEIPKRCKEIQEIMMHQDKADAVANQIIETLKL